MMVASHYPNRPEPLWLFPAAAARGELIQPTVAREVFEETALQAEVHELLFVGESYDAHRHVINFYLPHLRNW